MPDLGMRAIGAAVQFASGNDAHTDSGPHRYVGQVGLVPARTPAGFTQRGCIGVVLHGRRHTKLARQIVHDR